MTMSVRERPLASAVRMKSWLSTSSMEARAMRAMKPTCTRASARAGRAMERAQPTTLSWNGTKPPVGNRPN